MEYPRGARFTPPTFSAPLFPGLPGGFGEFRKRTQVRKHALEAVQVIEICVTFAKGLNLRFKGVAYGRRCNARRLSRCDIRASEGNRSNRHSCERRGQSELH